MHDIWHKYFAVESEIHFDRDPHELEAFFGGWQQQGFYEDGLFTIQHRDFELDNSFNAAYKLAIKNATPTASDPHVRWRARVFEYFLKNRLPGKCVELGTSNGFMFYFSLKKLQIENFDFENSKIYLVDKFDNQKVDLHDGTLVPGVQALYAGNISAVKKRFGKFNFVECIQGYVPDILSTFDLTEISFLHIDLNSAKPEVDALRIIWKFLSPNAIVLLDDYGFPNFASSQQAHAKLAKELGYEILGLPTGQGLIMRSRQ
jgi:hypothetical protein